MKALKTFAAITLITLAAISCKKENAGTPVPVTESEKRVSKMTTNGTYNSSFTYHSNGDIAIYTAGKSKTTYDYSNGSLNFKFYYEDLLTDELKNPVLIGGKLQSAKWFSYNADGSSAVYNFVFGYNNDGTLSYYTVDYNKYQFSYTNGNFSKVVRTGNGQLISTEDYEYYTDKPNKFNLPIQEHFENFPLLVKSRIGKQNTHLIKKATETRNGTTYIRAYTYQLDAAGYVTQITVVTQKNNEAPVTNVVDVQY